MIDKDLLGQLMQEAMEEDCITCPECGELLEIEDKKCRCGWKNLLTQEY